MSAPARLKVRLRKPAEFALKTGHPWVFADSIAEQNRPMVTGEIGVIYDRTDRLLALALCERDSPIAMRVVHRATPGKPQTVDATFWAAALATAVEKRAPLTTAEPQTTGYRLIHGENDGFPGLVVDRYADVAVVKVYTSAWFPHFPLLKELLSNLPGINHLMLRLSRHAQAKAGKMGISEGWWHGQTDLPVLFQENGIVFEADVLHGQKTGFFLDQRENRQRVEAMTAGKHVLNAFSYTGGFSLYAARGGARSVTDLDVSPQALQSSQRNFQLNAAQPRIHAAERRTILADAFAWMESGPRQTFDFIITDPPSLAKKESEKEIALRRYELLNTHALRRLTHGGTLVAASCSAHVRSEDFFSTILRAGKKSGLRFQELWRSGAPADHPATFPEAHYLKAIALKLV